MKEDGIVPVEFDGDIHFDELAKCVEQVHLDVLLSSGQRIAIPKRYHPRKKTLTVYVPSGKWGQRIVEITMDTIVCAYVGPVGDKWKYKVI